MDKDLKRDGVGVFGMGVVAAATGAAIATVAAVGIFGVPAQISSSSSLFLLCNSEENVDDNQGMIMADADVDAEECEYDADGSSLAAVEYTSQAKLLGRFRKNSSKPDNKSDPLRQVSSAESHYEAVKVRNALERERHEAHTLLMDQYKLEAMWMDQRDAIPKVRFYDRAVLQDRICRGRETSRQKSIVLRSLEDKGNVFNDKCAKREAMVAKESAEFDQRVEELGKNYSQAKTALERAERKSKSFWPWQVAAKRKLASDAERIRQEYSDAIQQYKTLLLENPQASSKKLESDMHSIVEKSKACYLRLFENRRSLGDTFKALDDALDETPKSDRSRRAELEREMEYLENDLIPETTKQVVEAQKQFVLSKNLEKMKAWRLVTSVAEIQKMYDIVTGGSSNPSPPAAQKQPSNSDRQQTSLQHKTVVLQKRQTRGQRGSLDGEPLFPLISPKASRRSKGSPKKMVVEATVHSKTRRPMSDYLDGSPEMHRRRSNRLYRSESCSSVSSAGSVCSDSSGVSLISTDSGRSVSTLSARSFRQPPRSYRRVSYNPRSGAKGHRRP